MCLYKIYKSKHVIMNNNFTRYLKMPTSMKVSASALCLVILYGCNNENVYLPSTDGTEGNNQTQLVTPRTFLLSEPDRETPIDVNTIYSGKGLTVNDIVSNDPSCEASINMLQNDKVSVKSPAGTFCHYTLDISTQGGLRKSHSSEVLTFSSKAKEPQIEPRIGSLNENGWIDVERALGEKWPVGYKLASVFSLDGDADIYDAQLVDKQLHLNVDEFEGFTALRYVLVDETRISKPKTGVLVVAKEERNTQPMISKPLYNLTGQAGIKPKMFQEITVSLNGLPNFDITTARDWQLSYVYSIDATVAAFDNEDVTNKKFKFVASKPGEHTIIYVVQNDLNEMALGTMLVTVLPKEKAIDWEPVKITNTQTNTTKIFPGPVLYSQALAVTTPKALWDATADNTFAGVDNISAAETLCASKGRMPFGYELEAVYQESLKGNVDISGWPKSLPYLVYSADKSREQAFDLATGKIRDKSSEDELLNMTCLEFQELMIQNTTTTFIVNQKKQVALLTKKNADSEYDLSVVSDVLNDSNIKFETKAISSSDRQIAIYATSNKGGVFKIKATDRDDESQNLESRVLAAVGDWDELQFSDEVTMSKPYLLANDTQILEVGIRMVDDDGNGIPDKSFDVSTDLRLVSQPWFDWSDLEGRTSFKVKATSNSIPAGAYEATVTATAYRGDIEIDIPIHVTSVNYYHTITPVLKHTHKLYMNYDIEVRNAEGDLDSQELYLTNGNLLTHVMMTVRNGYYQLNASSTTPKDGKAKLVLLPINPFYNMPEMPQWAPTTDYLNLSERPPEKKVALELSEVKAKVRTFIPSEYNQSVSAQEVSAMFNEGEGVDQIVFQNNDVHHMTRWLFLPDLPGADFGKTVMLVNYKSGRTEWIDVISNGKSVLIPMSENAMYVYVWVGDRWSNTKISLDGL